MKYRRAQEISVQNSPSVQAVSKQDSAIGRLSPTHIDHWKNRVFVPTYTRDGEIHHVATYSCKIQFAGRRETFRLHTSNRDEAARKAREIYIDVLKGWDHALAIHKPKPAKPVGNLTVGQFLLLVAQLGLITAVTLTSYRTKLRTIVSVIRRLGSGRGKGTRRLEWRAAVDAQALKVITPEALDQFKRDFLARAAADPVSLRHAQVSFDCYIRNMRSLFRKEVLDELAKLGAECPPMPFRTVAMAVKGRSGFKYVSNIQPEALMKGAVSQLFTVFPEQFKVFALALLLGLRRGEIDQLRWDMINWERRHIALVPHEFLSLKTQESSSEISVPPELVAILRLFQESATGAYVVASPNSPRKAQHYRHYRCEPHFKALCTWLRNNGVNTRNPIHTLRKECGSLVNELYGLIAAKNILRHATIEITATYYACDRRRVSTGLEMGLPHEERKAEKHDAATMC